LWRSADDRTTKFDVGEASSPRTNVISVKRGVKLQLAVWKGRSSGKNACDDLTRKPKLMKSEDN
jgi:hypothetical protein